nr:MAG TPA: hypothetical protein [Caudoviricetes sp.]
MGLCQLKVTMIFAYVEDTFYLNFPFSKKINAQI